MKEGSLNALFNKKKINFKNMESKRFAVCLIWERSENNETKRSSKLIANVDANSQEEAVGLRVIEDRRLFENWRLAAALVQEQVVAEQEEQKETEVKPPVRFPSTGNTDERVISNEHYQMFCGLLQYFKTQDEFDKSVAFTVAKAEYAEPLMKGGF